MIRTLKIVSSLVLNMLTVAFAGFAIVNGADPTMVGLGGLAILGLLNGLELSELVAIQQALAELDTNDQQQDE